MNPLISIAICDDEAQFQKILKDMVARYMKQLGVVYSLKTFSSGNELVDYCATEPELTVIFLDISMDEIDGIETAKRIRAMSEDVYIVFVTAYYKYSLEGYKVNAIRYLIKGDKNFEETLQECIDTILERINFNTRTITFDFREGRKDRFDKVPRGCYYKGRKKGATGNGLALKLNYRNSRPSWQTGAAIPVHS